MFPRSLRALSVSLNGGMSASGRELPAGQFRASPWRSVAHRLNPILAQAPSCTYPYFLPLDVKGAGGDAARGWTLQIKAGMEKWRLLESAQLGYAALTG